MANTAALGMAGAGPAGPATGGNAGRAAHLRAWLAVRWVAGGVILVGWFVYYPIVDNFIVSTTDQDIFTGETRNIGFANYERLLRDPIVWISLWNNCLYAVVSVVFQVWGAFLLAAMIEGLDSET